MHHTPAGQACSALHDTLSPRRPRQSNGGERGATSRSLGRSLTARSRPAQPIRCPPPPPHPCCPSPSCCHPVQRYASQGSIPALPATPPRSGVTRLLPASKSMFSVPVRPAKVWRILIAVTLSSVKDNSCCKESEWPLPQSALLPL